MQCAHCVTLSFCLAAGILGTTRDLSAAAPRRRGEAPAVRWMSDYAEATFAAQRQRKMLFIYFFDTAADSPCGRFTKETFDDPQVRRKLRDYVCVRLALDAKTTIRGKPIILLEHEAFREMLGKPGVSIVDYRPADAKRRGAVISEFPITEQLWYTPEQMAVILTLPPGTLTQRTLIYAVRTHPDHPASTEGEPNSVLLEEAQNHAQYQANCRVLGHQFWDSRFRRILSRLPGGGAPREVCAQSWGHENLVEAAIECVRCWRSSSGHWSAVRARTRFFGYDMKRADNGVWYATGIVDAR
jgi:hypothetical protein